MIDTEPANPSTLPKKVTPDEFCRMLVSNKHLSRCDQPARHLRGLRDSAMGVIFVVDEARLERFLARSPRRTRSTERVHARL